MKRSPLKKLGKKGLAWAKARNELKKECVRLGITRCELGYLRCWGDNHLGFAHSLKRRNITTPALLREAILVCNSCHDMIEGLPEEEMAEVVRSKLAGRKD